MAAIEQARRSVYDSRLLALSEPGPMSVEFPESPATATDSEKGWGNDTDPLYGIESTQGMQIEVDGFPIFVLNRKQMIAIRVSYDLVRFVRLVIIPLAFESACKAQMRETKSAKLPDISGKVLWSSGQHSWKIRVRKKSFFAGYVEYDTEYEETFPVNPRLQRGTKEYLTAYFLQYREAILKWNILDSSDRERIQEGSVWQSWCLLLNQLDYAPGSKDSSSQESRAVRAEVLSTVLWPPTTPDSRSSLSLSPGCPSRF